MKKLNSSSPIDSLLIITIYLSIVAIFELTALLKYTPVSISIKTQIYIGFFLALISIGMKNEISMLFRFKYSNYFYLFLSLVIISQLQNIFAYGLAEFFRIQEKTGSYYSIIFFVANLLLMIMIIYVLNSINRIFVFLKVVAIFIFVASLIARLSILGINTNFYAFYSANTELRDEGLFSYSVTKIGGELINRETFLWLDTNTYANLLVVGIILLLFFLLRASSRFQRISLILAIFISFSSLIATYSRGGIFQLIIGVTILLLLSKKKYLVRNKYKYLLSLVGLFVILSVFFPLRFGNIFLRLSSAWDLLVNPVTLTTEGDVEGAAIGRYLTAQKAFAAFIENPALGSGGLVVSTIGSTANHSELLEILCQFGIFASFLFYSFLILPILKLNKLRKRILTNSDSYDLASVAIVILIVCIIRMISDPVFYTIYVVISLGLAIIQIIEKDPVSNAT